MLTSPTPAPQTHKTASTTLGGVMFRFGARNGKVRPSGLMTKYAEAGLREAPRTTALARTQPPVSVLRPRFSRLPAAFLLSGQVRAAVPHGAHHLGEPHHPSGRRGLV